METIKHQRSPSLQRFVAVARAAFNHSALDPTSHASVQEIFLALETVKAQRPGSGTQLPVCRMLPSVLTAPMNNESLGRLLLRFEEIEPSLIWRRRENVDGSASSNFVDGHANAMIFGPGGLEERHDVLLGVSILAPDVRYPDHNHAPEETYLVLSDGAFRQGQGDWFTPGVGGSFYNEPNVRHAMRSGETPLFAMWALRPG